MVGIDDKIFKIKNCPYQIKQDEYGENIQYPEKNLPLGNVEMDVVFRHWLVKVCRMLVKFLVKNKAVALSQSQKIAHFGEGVLVVGFCLEVDLKAILFFIRSEE